jgi:hypothetical protein
MTDICLILLRKTCESIAISCLAAHETHLGVTGMNRHYSAEKIIKALDKLDPAFYPEPVSHVETDEDGSLLVTPGSAENCLSKDQLVELWNYCGDNLHIGSLKSIRKRKVRTLGSDDIHYWHERIVKLLDRNIIYFTRRDEAYFVQLGDPSQPPLLRVAPTAIEPVPLGSAGPYGGVRRS